MARDPSKTEKPTAKRIQKAREEGNVMMSADISSLAVMLAGTITVYLLGPALTDGFERTMNLIFSLDCRESWTRSDIVSGMSYGMIMTGKIMTPSLLLIMLAGGVAMRAQVGKYFSMKAVKWKFNFMNFKNGLKELLPNRENAVKLLLTSAKVLLIGSLVYFTVKNELDAIKELGAIPLTEALQWLARHCLVMIYKMLALFILIAAIDYLVRRKKYYDNLMMSKQEVKDERRNAEGDPAVKGRIRRRMRELLRGQMMRNLPQADVVVTNPTHVAVALRYEPGGYAPRVVAKGLRLRAERIKEIARFHRIPIVEAPPLARSLYRHIPVGGYIGEEFYGAVAAILARLHRLGKGKFYRTSASGTKTAH
ncbi:MAG: EscU/YscU/HrcU family type III secretion system export apparatus switch protein [Victivallales bacterium]|nr:EscU/YscU/HrcU family type III secretion system export apparatus switch protein [Victivallales bacterium]